MKPHIDLPQLTCSYKSFRSILLKPIHQVFQEAACKFIFMIRQFSRYWLIYRVLIARSFAGSVFIIYRSFNLYIWEAQIKCPQNHHVFLINGPDYLLIHIVHLKYHYLLSNFQRISYSSFWFLISLQYACWMKTKSFIVWPLLLNFYSVKKFLYFLWNLQNSLPRCMYHLY